MAAMLTEEEFSQHVNTKFRVKSDLPQPIELELEEVKSYDGKPDVEMERFSIYFQGGPDFFIQQGSYTLIHEVMGEFLIFLVPNAQNDRGFRYEAVFNYHRKQN